MQSLSRMCLGVAVALVCSVLTEGRSLPKGSVDDRIANLFRRDANGLLAVKSIKRGDLLPSNSSDSEYHRRGPSDKRWIGPKLSIDSVEDNRVANLLRREPNELLAVKSKRNDEYLAPTSHLNFPPPGRRIGRGIGRSVPKDFVEDKRMAKFSRRVANGLLPVKPKRDD
ncbi:unnamed protein product [Owenia fusiformis]|uniref:Uncharacterized protein n=1 Tax=Owenia fusiformis TaxID=6347 RepID=A0A8J1UFH2_OWEFU|nr:unnamed protein product [Owenia fusiformis]